MYFATLPMGGRNITRDITSLNLLEERAEDIKITSGNAIPRETVSSINYNGISDAKVSDLIVARAEEIVINVLKQVQYAELKDSDLPGGIVVIGGGSKLNGIIDLLNTKSGLAVTRGTLPEYIRLEEVKTSSTEIIEVASVLYAGGTSSSDSTCLEMPERAGVPVTGEKNQTDSAPEEDMPEEEPRHRTPSGLSRFLGKIGTAVSGMFSGTEDDSDPLD